MRVLYVTDFYAPYVGGVEQHVRSLAHAMRRRGHEVAVATQLADPEQPALEDDDGVAVHRIRGLALRVQRPAEVGRPWAPPIVDPGVLLALRRIVRAVQPDVVHGHDWLARSAWPLCLRRRPLVVSLHYYTRSCATKALLEHGREVCSGPGLRKCTSCSADHYGRLRGPVIAAANAAGAWIDDRVATGVIGVSEATLRGNGLAPGGRRVVVPNLLPDAVPQAGRAPAGLPDGPFLLYVGDLRAQKGLDVLLEAYQSMVAPPPLVLIGELVGASPRRFPVGVTVVGPVPNDVVLAAWERATVGVVPSIWEEPFGIVVVEAMRAGCPVVASAIGGIPEIIDHDQTGILVPPRDPRALAAALEDLLADEPRRARIAAAGQRASDRYRADVVAAEVEAVYARAIGEGRGRARG